MAALTHPHGGRSKIIHVESHQSEGKTWLRQQTANYQPATHTSHRSLTRHWVYYIGASGRFDCKCVENYSLCSAPTPEYTKLSVSSEILAVEGLASYIPHANREREQARNFGLSSRYVSPTCSSEGSGRLNLSNAGRARWRAS